MAEQTGLTYPTGVRRDVRRHRTGLLVAEDGHTGRLKPVRVFVGDSKALRHVPRLRRWVYRGDDE